MLLSVAKLFGPSASEHQIEVDFEEKIISPDDWKNSFQPSSKFSGHLRVIRTEENVLVLLSQAEISGEVECAKCLQKALITLSFKNSDQIFYTKSSNTWGEEEFVIDPQKMAIDLTPFFLQEISIRIPASYMHPDGKCDPEMLRRISAAQVSKDDTHTPLAKLRDLLPPKASD